MEAPPPAEAMDDNKCVSLFLEWCNKGGYLTRTRFDNAKEEDLDAIPLSFEQLDRVLLLLEERDPAAWSDVKAVSPAAPAAVETAATAIAHEPVQHDAIAALQDAIASGVCVICYDDPISVTLVHANETSHLCVCVACSDRLKAISAPCPVCREDIICHLKSMFQTAGIIMPYDTV
jgi:hypothetical protein